MMPGMGEITVGLETGSDSASGVPSIVTPQGGPKFLVAHGVNGYVAQDAGEFATRALDLMRDSALLSHLRREARHSSEAFSWDAVFDRVYAFYEICFPRPTGAGASPCEDLAPLFVLT